MEVSDRDKSSGELALDALLANGVLSAEQHTNCTRHVRGMSAAQHGVEPTAAQREASGAADATAPKVPPP